MILTGVCQGKASLYEIQYETLASWEGLVYVQTSFVSVDI